MKIQVGGLSEGIHHYRFSVPAADMNLTGNFEESVEVSVSLDKTATQILLSATIAATAVFACDRCVSEFRKSLASGYTMVYVSEGADTGHLDPAEVQVLSAGHPVIDITEDVRQTVILSVPLKLLCRESCKGLCPECGKNLNEGECGCPAAQVDTRWEQLRKLQSN